MLVTDAAGQYTVTSLEPGDYTLTVTGLGFVSEVGTGIAEHEIEIGTLADDGVDLSGVGAVSPVTGMRVPSANSSVVAAATLATVAPPLGHRGKQGSVVNRKP